jgi:hypothetical protein
MTKQTLKTNWKLWEAIGLLVILLAWGLEWRSVRKWEDAYNVYWRFLITFNQAAYTGEDQLARKFELAINRSVQHSELNLHDPFSAYSAAWEHAEVRQLWFNQSMFAVETLGEFAKNISQMAKRYGLREPPALSSLEDRRLKLLEELKRVIDPNSLTSSVPPVPTVMSVPVARAAQFRGDIRKLVSASIAPLNELGDAIELKGRSSSRYYAVAFLFGSLILVAAKTTEWRLDRDGKKGQEAR